jgi:hypothetical protein
VTDEQLGVMNPDGSAMGGWFPNPPGTPLVNLLGETMYQIYGSSCPFPRGEHAELDSLRGWDPRAPDKARDHFRRIAAILAEELRKAGLVAE